MITPRFSSSAFLSLLLICFFLTTGCYTDSTLSASLEPPNEWVKQWLNDPTCAPPCWMNIYPGTTTIYQAEILLSEDPDILIDNPPTEIEYPSINWMEMGWNFSDTDDGGLAKTSSESEVVSTINLYLNSDLTLEQVIDSYGKPSHVLTFDCRGVGWEKFCITEIIYHNSGLVLESLLKDNGDNDHSVEVLPNTKIDSIHFFHPIEGFYTYPVGTDFSNFFKDLLEWNG
jgi:hypothetical protein